MNVGDSMVKIKICGFTNSEDAKQACQLGVDLVGVILVPESPHYVSIDAARDIFRAVERTVAKVAVFAPHRPEDIKETCRKLNPDYLQFHLTFPLPDLLRIKEELNVGIIIVVSIPRGVGCSKEIVDRAVEVSKAADFLLIDTKGPTGGGTGLTHDWHLSAMIRSVVEKPVFLAGGLNPSNVGQAIKMVRPYGVDVATGVEINPRKKDPKLMRDFVEAVRRAE